jgi:HlyD family secretion protein
MTPEEREQLMQRMRGSGGDPSANGAAAGGARAQSGRRNATADAAASVAAQPSSAGATTIDALFGPLPVVETRGRVWIYVDKQLKPIPLRLGISDGQATELIEGDLQPGTEVVTNVITGNETRPSPVGGFPPFMGQPGRGGFPGGGRGPGGGGGGGGRGR